MTLTIVGLDGTTVVLNEADVGNLTSYRAYGGTKNKVGTIGNKGNYTGVPITTFLNMVGGIRNGYSVKIMALGSSPYSQILNYLNLNGTGLNTYDNITGAAVQHNKTLTPMLAYYRDDVNLTSGGPLRLVIVGPEGLLTDSSLWVQNVSRLEVHPTALQPMSLEVVALNSTSITLNQTTMSNLPALRAVGERRNQLGYLSGLGNYTGVSLNTLCNLVGGMNNNTALRITASDNYTQTLSYEKVNGEFTTYDPITGNPVQHNQSLTPILAYYFNDANLSSSDGPLRLVIVGPEGLATDSSYWVKHVVKLEIRYIDDVAITEVSPSKTVVGQGYLCNVNVTIVNQGGYDEAFNVTLYANQTSIEKQTVTLLVGNFETLTFTWDTTSYAKGNYTIKAVADSVQGETDTADNTFVSGIVTVGMVGDVNADGIVEMMDFFILSQHYMHSPPDGHMIGTQLYHECFNADVNSDGIIEMMDFYILSQHYMETEP
jgi:hypothetical protein